jgi:ATP-dependent helicase/nuclease subunit A
MSSVLKDKEARERIRQRIGAGMAVEAAAGTGKTTEMVERIQSLIRSGVSVRRIAAITFTEKAAAELELRVREELERAAQVPGLDRAEREKIAAALSELDAAQISTIHAFALAMLKERPLEARVDPEAEIMDEVRDALWFADAWEQWIETLDREDFRAMARAVRLGLGSDKIKELARALALNRDVAEILKEQLEKGESLRAEDVTSGLAALADRASKLMRECEDQVLDQSDLGYGATRKWHEAVSILAGESEGWILFERLLRLDQSDIPLAPGAKKKWKSDEFNKERKARMQGAREDLAALQQKARALVMDQVLLLLSRFVDEDWERRRAAGLINFQDVLMLARDLLRDPEARKYYRERWSHLLVDEFQDTDPLQVEIMDSLFGDRPEGLFLVGDPKQSIYRFRRADISIYRKRVEELVSSLKRKPEVLETNFRSVPGIVEWVNRLFEKIIIERAPFQAAYSPMIAFRPAAKGLPPPVSALHPADEEIFSARAGQRRVIEANHVAALIESMVGSGRYRVRDKDHGLVPLKYQHVAVLYFTRPGEPEAWLNPFISRGIPFVTDLGREFFLRDEVSSVLLALRAIEDPSDSLALFGALRGPLFGVSDLALFQFKCGGGKLDYRESAEKQSPEIEAAFQLLRELHLARQQRPIAVTIERLLAATGARLSSLVSSRSDLGVMNLERLLASARSFQELQAAGYSGFVSHLAEIADLELTSREPVSLDPDEDFVRMSTVHGAKGLEFPVVIIANLDTALVKDRNDHPRILAEWTGEKKAAARFGPFKSSGYESMEATDREHLLEESKRLFYVAATRARDALVLSVFPPSRPDPEKAGAAEPKLVKYLDLLPERLRAWDPERTARTEDKVYYWGRDELKLELKEGSEKATMSAPRDVDVIGFRKKREQVLREASKKLVVKTATGERERAERDYSGEESEERRAPARDEGMRIGSLVHQIMEELDLGKASAAAEAIAAACDGAGLAHRKAEVLSLVNSILASPPVRRAAKSGSAHREAPYCVWSGEEVHEGKMDLVFREDDRMVVVDYKTDAVAEEEAAARVEDYRAQGEEYREAVKQAAGCARVEVWFVFARAGKSVEMKEEKNKNF